ncbi:hypothetical protein JXA88_17555, partial [Candidatus Fermentibacteria bacterium]|nr:hypothetical protein [Candidatus Fermentibacteria bacterium]
PQGVAPQNILNYYGRVDALHIAMASFTDHVKGVLLGLFPSGTTVGQAGSGWIGVLPPLLLFCAVVGLLIARPRWLVMIGAAVTLFTFADSFTSFSGTHWHRHLHVFTPFLIGFGLLGARLICGTQAWAYRTIVGFFFVVILLQLVGSLAENRRAVGGIAADKAAVDHIAAQWPGALVMDESGKAAYWGDNRVRWFVLSPQVDAEMGRLVRRFGRLTELGEVIQRRSPDLWLDYGVSGSLGTWLRSVTDSLTTVWAGEHRVQIRGVRPDALADSRPYPSCADELDVGDPLSEYAHGYRWRDDLIMPAGGFLHRDGCIADGGRPLVTREQFTMRVPPHGVLVARYRAEYDGFDLGGTQAAVSLNLDRLFVTILAQGDTVYHHAPHLSSGFVDVWVPLSVEGPTQFEVSGLFHSYHYWTASAPVEPRGVVANEPGDESP